MVNIPPSCQFAFSANSLTPDFETHFSLHEVGISVRVFLIHHLRAFKY
jgi:hypothetical protein